jgi:hypothetical protein
MPDSSGGGDEATRLGYWQLDVETADTEAGIYAWETDGSDDDIYVKLRGAQMLSTTPKTSGECRIK